MQNAAENRNLQSLSIRLPEKRFSDFGREQERDPQKLRLRQIERYNSKSGDLTGYDCELCHNKGHSLRLIDGREVYEECRCMEIRKSLRQIKLSGLERAIQSKTFATFEEREDWQRRMKEKAVQYAKNPEGWFIACGQPGSGKTHICTAIAGELLRKGIAVRYMLWREDSVPLKAVTTDKEEYFRRMEPLKKAQCLYIDDLFKGGTSAPDLKLAFELLDYRYRNDLPTILSTEKNLSDLDEIDEGIGSRIREMSQGRRVWIAKDKRKNWRYGKEQ